MRSSRQRPGTGRRRARRMLAAAAATALGAGAIGAERAAAINWVQAANGEWWQVNDGAMPGLDTGSIRGTTANGSTQNTTALLGYGGLRVSVSGAEPDRMDGELMRGFGLRFDGLERWRSTSPVALGGIDVARSLRIETSANWARWVDTFTNRTGAPKTVEVSFGGILGQGEGAQASRVVHSSSGDAAITSADSWVEMASAATAAGPSTNGPSATVLGTAGTGLLGSLLRPANAMRDPFSNPLVTVGHEANFYGFLRRFTLQPGETRSLLHFVVIGRAERAATAGSEIAAVRAAAAGLAGAPVVEDLATGELCELANWDLAVLDATLPATCATRQAPQPEPAIPDEEPVTSSPYDVVGKTIVELQADMASGKATSQQITRAYLDRIAAYDTGQWGLHSFIHVADDAMAQAKAADVARANGSTAPLLGVPVALKDLYDTKDMPTTNGSLVFEGFRPAHDAFQVRRLRDAGAVLIGKTNMSEFANSGRHSESPWGQVWNAIQPSGTAQGSSGGSAAAVAASFAAASMGSQTGVSLYAPASAGSLVTLRGTDGLASTSGVMPLTWMQDYAGAFARSVSDLAIMLNVTTGTDPADEATAEADARRPADWRTVLDPNALAGKRIGYMAAQFAAPTYGTPDSLALARQRLDDIRALGAELVAMPAEPSGTGSSAGGSLQAEGWFRYLEAHPEAPYDTPAQVQTSPLKLPYNRRASYSGAPMTPEQVTAARAARTEHKRRIAAWMDAAGVDAVLYPGNTSDFHDNDSGALGASFGSPPVSNAGVPGLIVPIGANEHGHPVSLHLVGRAWDDAKIVSFGYAIEQKVRGQVLPAKLPALSYAPGEEPQPIVIEKPEPPVTQPPVPDRPTNVDPPAPPAPAPPAPPAERGGARRAVTLRTSYALVRRGGALRLRVTVRAPKALAGRTVAVQRRIGRRVVTIGRLKLGASGRATRTVRLGRAAASYRVRLSVGATSTTRAGVTRFALVRAARR